MVGKEQSLVMHALGIVRLLCLGAALCEVAALCFLVCGWLQTAVYVSVLAVAIQAGAWLFLFLL